MLTEINCFINWQRRRNTTARTWRDYSYDLKQFVAVVGDQPPGSVTFQDVDQFITLQASRGYKPSTINRRLAAISSLYAFLSDEDPTLMCPVLPHRHSLREPQRLPRPVLQADLEKFFAEVSNDRDRAIFILMLRCGLRISEVTQLKLTDLFLKEEHPLCWLLNSSVQSFGTYANLLTSSEWDTILPNFLLSRRWVEYPGFNYKVQLWIRTNDPDVLYGNPVVEGPDSKAEFVWLPLNAPTSYQMLGFSLFLFGPRNEFKDLGKPDGLRFVRGLNLSVSETG
jgi:hypothetical protein